MKPVIIFGTGSYAQVAKVYLDADSPRQVVAFTVHDAYINEKTLLGIPVMPYERILETYPPDDVDMLVAMGASNMNQHRKTIYLACKEQGYQFIRYINSKAIQWGEVEVGENSFIFEANVLQPFVTIGDNTVLWSGNHIGHHSTIGNHVFITSHAVISGHVNIGDNCFVGVNATVVDGIAIAEYSLIGAGAFVTKNTESYGAYLGQRANKADRKSTEFKI